MHFQPLKRGQPLYKGQNRWSQHVLNSEAPLYNGKVNVSDRKHQDLIIYGKINIYISYVSGNFIEKMACNNKGQFLQYALCGWLYSIR